MSVKLQKYGSAISIPFTLDVCHSPKNAFFAFVLVFRKINTYTQSNTNSDSLQFGIELTSVENSWQVYRKKRNIGMNTYKYLGLITFPAV